MVVAHQFRALTVRTRTSMYALDQITGDTGPVIFLRVEPAELRAAEPMARVARSDNPVALADCTPGRRQRVRRKE